MGKPKHGIGSSMKALFNLRPLGPKTMTWVCVQQARTDSFREVYKNFNSMYSTSSSSMSKEERSLTTLPPTQEESISTSCSSTLTTESLPQEAACTRRFFFSPRTTKSIMEEEDHSAKKTSAMNDGKEEEEEAFVKELCFETEDNRGEEEMGFCKKSVRLSMASEDPYMDFRSSMEEMVMAHGLKDWSCLEELLHCYLKLNDEDTHKFIVLAFVDLLMATMEEEPKQGSSQVESTCSSCLSLDEEIDEGNIYRQEGKDEEIEHLNLF